MNTSMHLDLAAEDLDVDVAAAIQIGAREADSQASPDQWRVTLDPVSMVTMMLARGSRTHRSRG